jgi:ribulose kinase
VKSGRREALTIATAAALTAAMGDAPDVKSIGLDPACTFVIVRFKDGRSFVVEVREEPETAAA